jgi:hypothetical protein
VLYLPRLIQRMTRVELLALSAFQTRCILLMVAGGIRLHDDFEAIGLDHRVLSSRAMAMQDEIVRQMVAAHGEAIVRGVVNTQGAAITPAVFTFLYPEGGVAHAPAWHRALYGGLSGIVAAVDGAPA